MSLSEFRRNKLSRPLFKMAKKALPGLSDTEREALEAGDVWWDASLFSGNPDWSILLNTRPATLSEKERAFIDNQVNTLCDMVDEWQVNHELFDLPPDVWEFLKKERFFSMIIPEQYGGLEFSAYGCSEVVRKIASRSLVAAVTVMVPNSLGPGELLMQFGTQEQRDYWLPRLAKGEEVPCFGLTSPEAGSDAASMKDNGVVCKGTWNGKETLGIRLNWHKRYITLGPVATVLGLAFKLNDPDHLLGEEEELGITVALVPTDLEGINIGRRHIPSGQMFMNGPNWGEDVFIPMDHVLGGEAQIGKGWKMLMAALAAGRGVSLPSLASSGTLFAAHTTGAYARVREQFGIPIGNFEGIQHRLGRMAANAYLIDSANRLTCAGLDEGRKLVVISAIMKAHTTYRMRDSVIDAMDVHAGKAVIDGPSNYLSHIYQSLPVGITVEGANILTRNMIIFGQGAIRCHPWVLKEMLALENNDPEAALDEFDASFWSHVGHTFKTVGRAWFRAWTGSLLAPAPAEPRAVRRHYKRLNRYAAAFALLADTALLTLGGSLKRREMLSARLGDILSELYLLSAVLKRWRDDGNLKDDLPLVKYCLQEGFTRIEDRLAAVLRNLPNRPAAWLVKLLIQPLGARHKGPKDKLVRQCAEILLAPSEQRDRLTHGLHSGPEGSAVRALESAFRLVHDTEPLREKMRKAKIRDVDTALKNGVLTKGEAETLQQTLDAVARVIAVDDFAAEEITGARK